METRRRQPRKTLDQTIIAVDTINGGEFGELVNLSLEGMMLMTGRSVPVQSIFQLALRLPEPLLGDDHIDVGVDCLWCRQAEQYSRYWAGFQIIDASDQALAQLQALMAHFTRD